MNNAKVELIEKLTGIQSSKKSYYVELKKKIAETETKNTQLQIINHLAKSIRVEMSFDEILENVVDQLRQVMDFNRLSFSVLDGNKLVVTSVIPKETAVIPVGTELPRERSLFWSVIDNHWGLTVRDVTHQNLEFYEEQSVQECGLSTMVCIPLLANDKVLGILNLARVTKSPYSEPDLIFLQQFADQLAVCVENARLYTEIIRGKAEVIQSAKLAAIGQMAAGVAHELNNPLTAILGNAQLLLRGCAPDSAEYPLLEDINRCGARCKKIIQNLLTFSRQEQFPLEPLDLNQIVAKALPLVAFQISSENIHLETSLDSELPLVSGNSQQIEQVLINFLLNARDALEFSKSQPPGKEGKLIKIATGRAAGSTGWVFLAVHDNGHGIKSSDLPNIFNPFFTTKEVGRGTGLGLSVSLGIAEAHGGTIKVESKPGSGSTFTLLLPEAAGSKRTGNGVSR